MTSMVSYGAHNLDGRHRQIIKKKLQHRGVSVVVGGAKGSAEAYKMGTKLKFG